MSQLVAALILILTVASSVAVGVFAAYWSITGVLYAFHHHSQAPDSRGAVLVPSQTHAGGD